MINTQVVEKLNEYIATLKSNRELLWLVKLDRWSNSKRYKSQVSYSFLSENLGISKSVLSKSSYKVQINEITKLLILEKVILPEYGPSVLNMRRRLMLWWKSLTEKDKRSLDIFGNRIQISKYVENLRTGKGYELLKEEIEVIHGELLDMGVLDAGYVPVKNRDKLRNSKFHEMQSANKILLRSLGKLPLQTVDDLVEPDLDRPYVQWEQLFMAASEGVASESGKSNYQDALNHTKAYLSQCEVSPLSLLSESVNEFFLTSFKKEYLLPLLEQKLISPSTATTVFSSLRMTLKRATKIKNLGFKSFYDDELRVKGRVGESYKPYTLSEREQIDSAIKSDIAHIQSLMKEYELTGVGEDPLDSNYRVKLGMSTEDNARYLFEQRLNCKLIFNHTASTQVEKAFISITSRLDIGLHELYERWGILPKVSSKVLSPFLFQLCRITGLNPESAIDLDVDSYLEEHPLTHKPCIRYWKERGIGEQDVHLDLFNSEITWLPDLQGKMVKEIFDTVIELTKNIRNKLPPEFKNKLFIYQSDGRKAFDKVMHLTPQNSYGLYNAFIDRHKLVNDNGEPMSFSLSRFRPSFVSEMLEDGLSIRDIQVLLGHSSIDVTISYLDRLDFSRISRLKLFDALAALQRHGQDIRKVKRPKTYKDNQHKIIFQTPLSGCANIFDPPDFIKKSQKFKEGQACSQFNKCLSCENIMLSVMHLPILFALERHYIRLSEVNRVIDTPYGIVILENLAILEQILDPNESDFSSAELEFAKKQSFHIDIAEIESMGV